MSHESWTNLLAALGLLAGGVAACFAAALTIKWVVNSLLEDE